MAEEDTLFVYPQERRVWFLQTIEVWEGNYPDPCGIGEYDVYTTVVRSSDDRKDLSPEQMASMIFAKISAYDYDSRVSKASLSLLQ